MIAKGIDLALVMLLCSLFYPLSVLAGLIYLCLSDGIGEGQSVGKRLMGLAVISLEDGSPCSTKQSFIRNLPFAIPIFFTLIPLWGWIFFGILGTSLFFLELYLMYKLDSAHRLGDVMADTTVIANDANRVDLKKAQTSWFKADKSMSPCN